MRTCGVISKIIYLTNSMYIFSFSIFAFNAYMLKFGRIYETSDDIVNAIYSHMEAEGIQLSQDRRDSKRVVYKCDTVDCNFFVRCGHPRYSASKWQVLILSG